MIGPGIVSSRAPAPRDHPIGHNGGDDTAHVEPPGRAGERLAGTQLAPGSDLDPGGDELRRLLPAGATGSGCACSTTTAPSGGSSCWSSPWASGTPRSPACWPAPATATGSRAPGTPSAACASTSTSCWSTPTRWRSPARCRTTRPSTATSSTTPRAPEPGATPRPYVPRSVVVARDFDWEGDVPMRRRWRDTVIYEMHVKGMTALHDRVPEELRGTYAGLATPAVTDYLRDLGVTAVELLPIHQFATEPGVAARGQVNYWGYNTLNYFSPHNAYAASGDRGQQVTRVQGDGEGPAPRRAGGHPRRRLQPHRGGRAAGADAQLPRARRPRLLPAGAGRPRRPGGARHLLGRHRLRQHRRHHPHPVAAAGPGLAALLGHRDARRRVPLRPDLRADPHPAGGRHGQPPARPPSARTRCCGTSS